MAQGDVVLGIDLGTTNSVVAVADGEACRVLHTELGHRLIPSVVSFKPDGGILVGEEARERRLIDATHTVYSVKRLIGRPFKSPEVKRAQQRFAFPLVPNANGGVVVDIRGETYTLTEISAFVLREIRRIAERELGQAVSRAVITVPANFNELQRSATKAAGRVAGLQVERIINEPTAAALAYGYGKGKSAERVAVFDLGGGTFDLTILELEDDVFEVLATAGDSFLGGDDLDLVVAELMCDAFLDQHRWDPRQDDQAFERLRAAAEWAKCQLSSETAVELTVEELHYGRGGKALDLEFQLERPAFEDAIRPLVARAFDVCNQALREADMKPGEVDSVVLVGGSTRVPLVRGMVEEFFGKTPHTEIDPDLVVAQGAAIHGYALAGRPKKAPSRRKRKDSLGRVALKKMSRQELAKLKAERDKRKAALPKQPAFAPGPPAAPPPPAPAARSSVELRSPQSVAPGKPLAPKAPPRPKAPPAPKPPAATPPAATPPVSTPPVSTPPVSTPPVSTPPVSTQGSLGAEDLEMPMPAPGPRPEPSVRAKLPSLELDDPLLESQAPPSRSPSDHEQTRIAAVPEELRRRSERPLAPTTEELDIDEVSGLMALDELDSLPPAAPKPPPPPAPPQVQPPTPEHERAPERTPEPAPAPAVVASGMVAVGEPELPSIIVDDGLQAESFEAPSIDLDDDEPELTFGEPEAPAPAPDPFAANVFATGGGEDLGGADLGAAPLTDLPGLDEPAPAPPDAAVVAMPDAAPPLLMDVTPHSLGLETAGGYTQHLIRRNAPIPSEQSRVFTTASDDQDSVRVRICQGEERAFLENQALGEIELLELRPAPRGEVKIDVTFIIDASGTLAVKARDVDTGRAQEIQINLLGGADDDEIERMRQRQQQLVG